ncbi:hypothetical protein [Pseudonocardia nigra]|uniref:hypothetical protein n=1 Tax=Pseudonocardia nigra TaxID=1921578 RepID=UPI001C5D6773|nr:hypothetical protein [Pseudonocardia nigra]
MPYISYWNHKMRREAFVPIERGLLTAIRHQQQRVADPCQDQRAALLVAPAPRVLPYTGLRLVPRLHVDRTGTSPAAAAPTNSSFGSGSRNATSPTKPAVPWPSPPTSGATPTPPL